MKRPTSWTIVWWNFSSRIALFVFSITNPWAPSAWEFLKSLHTSPSKNVVFVLQQCDLRDTSEVEPVWKHLEQFIHERFSPAARVFAVSAKKALLARTTGTDKEGLMQQSNFASLESYLNDTVAHSEERLGTLRSVCHSARCILLDASARVESALHILARDAEKLTGMQHAIDEHKEQSLRHVSGVLWTLAQCYERLQKRCERTLEERLSFSGAVGLKKGATRPAGGAVDHELQDSIRRQIHSSIELLESDLTEALHDLHDYARTQLSSSVDFEHAPEFMEEREQTLQAIETGFVEKTSETHLQQRMRELFHETAAWLKVPPGEGTDAVIEAMASFVTRDLDAVLAEAIASAGKVVLLMKRGRILLWFRSEVARRREEFLAALERQLREATVQFYGDAATICQPFNHLYVVQRGIYDGRAASVKQMEENFGSAAASLGMPAAIV